MRRKDAHKQLARTSLSSPFAICLDETNIRLFLFELGPRHRPDLPPIEGGYMSYPGFNSNDNNDFNGLHNYWKDH